jgi:hypothetical protein
MQYDGLKLIISNLTTGHGPEQVPSTLYHHNSIPCVALNNILLSSPSPSFKRGFLHSNTVHTPCLPHLIQISGPSLPRILYSNNNRWFVLTTHFLVQKCPKLPTQTSSTEHCDTISVLHISSHVIHNQTRNYMPIMNGTSQV